MGSVTIPQNYGKEINDMEDKTSIKGNLIERKGKYYVIINYYANGQRKQSTKSTRISVNSHKKREAEKIRDSLVQEKKGTVQGNRAERTAPVYRMFQAVGGL